MPVSKLALRDAESGFPIPLATYDDADGHVATGNVLLTGLVPSPTGPANPLHVVQAGSPAQEGADALGVAMPFGGAGIRGWLSGIYARLTTTLTVEDAGARTQLTSILAVLGGSLRVRLTDGVNAATVTPQGSVCVSGATGAGAQPATAPVLLGGVDGSGIVRVVLTDAGGSLRVNQSPSITYAAPSGGTEIATAGVAQILTAAGEVTNGLQVINPVDATATLYVDPVGTAAPGSGTSIPLPPGSSQTFGAATGAITVFSSAPGHRFKAIRA